MTGESGPLAAEVADLRAAFARLRAELDGVQANLGELAAAAQPAAEDPTEGKRVLAFILMMTPEEATRELAALADWVQNVYVRYYGQEVSPLAPWCAQWFEHGEAVARLHAAWMAWQADTDPVSGGAAGPSFWHRDHLDPMVAQLRSPTGPFAACMTSPGVLNHVLLPAPDVAPFPYGTGSGRDDERR